MMHPPNMNDQQYIELPFHLNERQHKYGQNVHLISDPLLLTQLARVCSPICVQPEANRLICEIYRELGQLVANYEFPRINHQIPTRMREFHEEAVYKGQVIDPKTKVVFVSLARAGTVPSLSLFEEYSAFLDPDFVRVDHIFINRTTDATQKVTGASIHGSKIGGSVQDVIVIFPDPMGATGNSLSKVIQHYKETVEGTPKRWISLNLIITPEYIAKLKAEHAETIIYAVRLDRGFSSKRALESVPGTYPDEERGLNDQHYVVPGGGGFGEISSNSWV